MLRSRTTQSCCRDWTKGTASERGIGADHQPGLEGERRNAAGLQNLAHLDSRSQVWAELLFGVKSGEIYDSAHLGLLSRCGHTFGASLVQVSEVSVTAHGMYEEIEHIHFVAEPPGCRRVREISLNHLDLVASGNIPQRLGPAGQHPNPVPRLQQLRHKTSSDVTCSPSHCDVRHGMSSRSAITVVGFRGSDCGLVVRFTLSPHGDGGSSAQKPHPPGEQCRDRIQR